MVENKQPGLDSVPRFAGREAWDALVIGAGPAGAVSARLLALSGARVLLVERRAFPRPKVCGACWSAAGLRLLEALGAGPRLATLGGCPLHRLQVHSGKRCLTLPIPAGLAVPRASIDDALVQHATEAGVVFRPRTRARVGPELLQARLVQLQPEGLDPLDIMARIVVAADGLGHPSLADLPEFQSPAASRSHIGAGCQLAAAMPDHEPGTIYMAVGQPGYVGAVLAGRSALTVAAALAPEHVRRHGSLAHAAAEILRQAHAPEIPGLLLANWRGTPLLTRRERRVAGPRLFLVGDSAGYAEPFTGEGLTWAVLGALALHPMAQRAWQEWRPELAQAWTSTHAQALGCRQRNCRALAQLLRSDFAVRSAMRLLSLTPGLASPAVRFFSAPPAYTAIK